MLASVGYMAMVKYQMRRLSLGKRTRPEVQAFLADLDGGLGRLSASILAGRSCPSPIPALRMSTRVGIRLDRRLAGP